MGQIFYGWKITGASFVILFVAVGVGLYVPPVFLVPIEEHFGWSRAAIAGGSAIAALVSGLMSPLAGLWIDRYGSRRVMITGSLVMAGALYLVSRMTALWQLYAFTGLAGAGLTCVAWVPNQTLISNWFTRKRGLAMGIALTGIGFGGLAMSPLAAALIDHLGWRTAYAVLASIVGVVLTAVIIAIVRDRPADLGMLPDGAANDAADAGAGEIALETGDTGLGLGEALRTAAFWLLSACHFLWVFSNMSMIQH
ncbi:MAG: MFS transporter, partial [Deltaproteobacteria bacterium]